MIDAFSYLSVLLSIIVGLAITQVLQGYRALILARDRVKLAAVPLIWSVLLLFFAVQGWWASFGLRDQAEWSFAGFTVLLTQMILLYMMAAVVLPDVPDEIGIDLATHHDRHRRAFFGFLIALLGVSIAKDVVLSGHLPSPGNLAFHGVLASTALAGILVGGARAQLLIALFAAVGFTIYVAILFARI
ncbi:MAG: hypothetical protein H0X36_05545 [Sphingomonadaceae bacterium]|nr:hypothetical protein [Sphingomonadaceae bacterium]